MPVAPGWRKFPETHKGKVTRSGEKLSVPFELVHVQPGWNVRVMNDRLRAHIDWLKESILAKGIEDDLWGYPQEIKDPETGEKVVKIIPLNGHNRYQAVKELREEGHTDILIPFVHKARMNEEDRKALILSSNSGLPLTELEKAEVVRELHSKGWSIEKIAANYSPADEDFGRFGEGDTMSKIKRKIEWLLTLASADTATKELVNQQQVAPGNVIAAIKAFGDDPDLGSKAIQVTKILADAEGKTMSTGRITSSQTKGVVEQLLEMDDPEVVIESILEANEASKASGLPVIEHLPTDLDIPTITTDASKSRNSTGYNGKNPDKKAASTSKKVSTSSFTGKSAYLWNIMQTSFEGESAKLLDVVEKKDVAEKAKKMLAGQDGDYAFFQLADGKICILPFEFLSTLAISGHRGGNLSIDLTVISPEEEEAESKNLIVLAKR